MTDRTRHRLDRGGWGLFASLALAGIGLATGSQVLVAAATLPLWYVAAALFSTHQETTVRVRRHLELEVASDENEGNGEDEGAGEGGGKEGVERIDPDGAAATATETDPLTGDPGDTVRVRTTVENVGAEPIVDLRVLDGVPDALPVVSGSPRRCDTLPPGGTTTLEFEIELRRGDHTFEDATVRTRGLTGTVVETRTETVAGDESLRCVPVVEQVPLDGGTNDYAGEVPTDEGGTGVEFYAVREYASGDPVRSIDWRRYAGTRDLATIEYRAERSTRVVCVVDARTSQRRGATATDLSAVELSASAAERTVETLLAAGHPTGVATLHGRTVTAVPPGTDAATRRRLTELLSSSWTTNQLSGTDVRTLAGDSTETLPRLLPGEAQVYLFSSFVDDESIELVERLRTLGYAVRVVTPDVTDGADDTATRLEALDRDTRLARARAHGARVVDWELERPLGLVLHDAIGEVGTR